MPEQGTVLGETIYALGKRKALFLFLWHFLLLSLIFLFVLVRTAGPILLRLDLLVPISITCGWGQSRVVSLSLIIVWQTEDTLGERREARCRPPRGFAARGMGKPENACDAEKAFLVFKRTEKNGPVQRRMERDKA